MKKKEKMVIMVLLLITITLIVIGVVTKNHDNNETKISKNNSQINSNQERDYEKIPTVDEENITVLEDGTRLNSSKKLREEKTIDGIKLTDIQVTEKNNQTVILGKITNTTDLVKGGFDVKVIAVDKDGKEIAKINAYIEELKQGENGKFLTSASIDFANAYDFRIEKQ